MQFKLNDRVRVKDRRFLLSKGGEAPGLNDYMLSLAGTIVTIICNDGWVKIKEDRYSYLWNEDWLEPIKSKRNLPSWF